MRNDEGNSEFMNLMKDRFFDDTNNSMFTPRTPKNENKVYNSNSQYQTGGFAVSEKEKKKDNYFLRSSLGKNNNGNMMETIMEDSDNEDKSNHLIKNNLAIPPEKIIAVDNSLISNNSIFLPHLNNAEIRGIY